MDWCGASEYAKANHNPVAVLIGDKTKNILEVTAKSGKAIELSTADSSDPDKNDFTVKWFVYQEAGSYAGNEPMLSSASGEKIIFTAPATDKPVTVHVILQLEDQGIPSMFAYRWAIVNIEP